MFEYDEALKVAIENGEIKDLMQGNGKYHYEDRLSSGPVDYAAALRSIYKRAENDTNFQGYFKNVLNELCNGTLKDICTALAFLAFHLTFAEDEENTFDINVEIFLSMAQKKMQQLKDQIENSADEKRIIEYYRGILKTYGFTI